MDAHDNDLAAIPVCRRLRTKMYYLGGREHPNMRVAAANAQYWCSLTTTALGPDSLPCRPESCQSHRTCFENG